MNDPFAAASRSKSTGTNLTDGEMVDDIQALHTGLELARASQLTMLRLQLALHESNPRTAMRAVDMLLDIDAEMEGIAATLASLPAQSGEAAALAGFIGNQKAAIASEKHVLVGGTGRNDIRSVANYTPHGATDEETIAHASFTDDEWEGDHSPGVRPWLPVIAAILVILLMGFGLTVYLWPATFDVGNRF